MNIPSVADVAKNFIELGEMNKILLKRMEAHNLQIIKHDKTQKHLEAFKKILKNR